MEQLMEIQSSITFILGFSLKEISFIALLSETVYELSKSGRAVSTNKYACWCCDTASNSSWLLVCSFPLVVNTNAIFVIWMSPQNSHQKASYAVFCALKVLISYINVFNRTARFLHLQTKISSNKQSEKEAWRKKNWLSKFSLFVCANNISVLKRLFVTVDLL